MIPFVLQGKRRLFFQLLYTSICLGAASGIIYTSIHHPLLQIAALVYSYIANNIGFTIGHVGLHTNFIEQPESYMRVLAHHSFIHHYRDIQVYHKYWLETRISYFIDPKNFLRTTSCGEFINFFVFTPLVATLLPLAPAIAYVSNTFAAELLQSTTHEWYHNPHKNLFYSTPVYYFFSFLEKIKLIDKHKHITKHHNHNLNNLTDVIDWADLKIPFSETIPTIIWDYALTLYEPNKRRMSSFTGYVSFAAIVVYHLFGYILLTLCHTTLIQ